MRSLIMSDIETGSEWSHLLGEAKAGKLKGSLLKPLITDMVTWEAWKKKHPHTTVLDMSRTAREYTSEFYRDPQKFVFGFVIDGQAYTLPMPKMVNSLVHSFDVSGKSLVATFDQAGAGTYLYDSTVEGRRLSFERVDEAWMRDKETDSRWEITTGRAIAGDLEGKRLEPQVGIMSYAAAWTNFHPQSQQIDF